MKIDSFKHNFTPLISSELSVSVEYTQRKHKPTWPPTDWPVKDAIIV